MMFSDRVRGLVSPNGETMNLTKEQKEAILKVQNAGNAEVYENTATSVTAVEVAKAIEAANTGSQQTNSEIFASSIDLATTEGHVTIPCATSKATNIATGDLKDATVLKLIQTLEVHQAEGSVANAAIRNDSLLPFIQKSTEVTDDIVKKSSIRDFNMSGTVFPDDIQHVTELNNYINFLHQYKSAMMAEFLINAAKAQLTGSQKLTIYRCVSRSLAEDTFDRIWRAHNPLYDESDGAQVQAYIDAKKAFLGSLENIGNKYMSSSSIKFGMQLRKLSISPDLKWTSAVKVGHVKRFGAGKSYYVGTNVDSGIQTIPVTTSMLSARMKDIILLTRVGCALIENEVRAENGLSGKVEVPDYSAIKYDASLLGKQYNELLQIQATEQTAIYERLEEAFEKNAETVVQAVENQTNAQNAAALNALLGK